MINQGCLFGSSGKGRAQAEKYRSENDSQLQLTLSDLYFQIYQLVDKLCH